MEKDPHQLIEGVLIACYAIGAAQAFLYVRGEMALAQERHRPGAQRRLRGRLHRQEHPRLRLLASTSCSTGVPAPTSSVRRRRSSSRSRANRGMPRLKPPFFPAAKGLYLQPTVVNNVETLANLPWIIENGGARFAELGAETTPGHATLRRVRPRAAAGRLRGGVRRHHLPRPASTPRSTAAASATATSSRRSSPVVRSAPWFYEEHLDLPLEGRGGRGRGLDARLGSHRRHGRHDRRREGVLARRAVLRTRVVRQVHAVPRGHQLAREDARAASSTATVDPTTSTCCSTSATTSARGSPGRPSRRRSARSARAPCRRSHRRSSASRTSSWPTAAAPRVAGGDRRQGVHPAAHRGRRCLTPRRPPETVIVTVNGKEIEAAPGELVIAAAERNGVYIPRFCYHPRMEPVGMCRMCVVEIDTGRGAALQPACMIPVAAWHVGRHRERGHQEGAGRRPRVPPHQPPARLPRVRQGRRVPAAGPDPRRTARARAASSRRSATTRSRS